MSISTARLACTRVRTQLGESPRWDPRTDRFVWLDMRGDVVWTLRNPERPDVSRVRTRRRLTALAPRHQRGWVGATPSGVVVFDQLDEEPTVEHVLEADPAVARMNDGSVGPDGCFWAGSASTTEVARGSLYRFHPDGHVERLRSGLGMANGIGWAPDGSAAYVVDSTAGTVSELDLAPTRGGQARTVLTIPGDVGLPDGLAVDEEGGLWLAIWGAGCVRRYTPDGELDHVVTVDASRTTSCAFGGPDLSTLFITTAVRGSRRDQAPSDELGGRLFVYEPGIRGLRPYLFGEGESR